MTQPHEDLIGYWLHTDYRVLCTTMLRHGWRPRPGTVQNPLDVDCTAYGLRRAEVVVAEGGSVGAGR